MTKIQYVSDLHLEFPDNRIYLTENPIKPVADILIIAGDFIVFEKDNTVINTLYEPFIDSLAHDFEQVYIIPGNHEYYGGHDLSTALSSFTFPLRDNVTYLNNKYLFLDHYLLIFSTLWSLLPSTFPKHRFGDFHRGQWQGASLTIDQYNQLHLNHKKFLQKTLAEFNEQKKIIITHHLPSFSLIDPQYAGDELNTGFASTCDELISSSQAEYWIYGHSHSSSNRRVLEGTTLVTNPLGYVEYNENPGFEAGKVVMLGGDSG